MKQTLEQVEYQFAEWRQSKKHSREKIPPHLWQAAVALTSRYPKSKITRCLGLNECQPVPRMDQNRPPNQR